MIDWAAAAAALHDYDKAYELHLEALARDPASAGSSSGSQRRTATPLARWFDASESGKANAELIRPSLDQNPVSYMVALADQLQDLGRLNLDPSQRAPLTASLQISVPVQQVAIARDGRRLMIIWTLERDARHDVGGKIRAGKLGSPSARTVCARRGAAGVVFWPSTPDAKSWFDHGSWFEGITLQVVNPTTGEAQT